jgi:predicted transcriptional regulator
MKSLGEDESGVRLIAGALSNKIRIILLEMIREGEKTEEIRVRSGLGTRQGLQRHIDYLLKSEMIQYDRSLGKYKLTELGETTVETAEEIGKIYSVFVKKHEVTQYQAAKKLLLRHASSFSSGTKSELEELLETLEK